MSGYRFNDERDWFLEKRYGMFIHWGIYSVEGRGEWARKNFNIPREEYDKNIALFRAETFDPAEWVNTAKNAGMEYIVFTSKHHDGFCMWDTAYTDYNVMHTPFGKDPLKMLADECHKQNMPLVIYYSCMDWAHENYPNDGTCCSVRTDPSKHDMKKYMEFLKNQIRELCTRYGKIHGIWWEGNNTLYMDPSVNEMIHQLQPAAVINDRGFSVDGDFRTPERTDLQGDAPFSHPTEACDSIATQGWCCMKDGDFHSARYCMESITQYIAHGANYLLNIAPCADGHLQEEYVEVLKRFSPWYHKVREALYAPHQRWVVYNEDMICTGEKSGNVLYVFLMKPPKDSIIPMIPINSPAENAVLLNTGKTLLAELSDPASHKEQILRIRHYPADELYGEIPVLKITFKDSVEIVMDRAATHHYAW